MSSRFAKLAAGGVAAAVLSVGVVVGVVNARPSEQSPTPTPTPTAGAGQQRRQQAQQRMDEFLNRLAQNLGITTDKLKDGLKQTAIQEIDQAQADGRLTPDQAQRMKDAINNGTFPGIGPGGLFGRGFPGPMGAGLRVGIPAADKLAGFLGITTDQLRTELRDKSLADVAAAHGKTADQLKQFIQDNAQQALTQAVQNGRITQQQADQALNALKSRLDNLINRKPGDPMPGMRMRRGR